MTTALQVAKYLLIKAADDDSMTNMKLQKLLYYCQGFNLAIHDRPLFGERIEAWTHGPVVPEVYDVYKSFGSAQIDVESSGKPAKLTKADSELVDEVFEVYGRFSASTLRQMTHREPPWKDTPAKGEISHASMRRFFKTRLVTEHN